MDYNAGNHQAQQNTVPQKSCKKCGALIPKYSDRCPNCGANLKPLYKKAWFWVLIVLLVFLLCLGSCAASCSKAVNDSTNSISTKTTDSSSSAQSSGTAKSDDASKQKYTIADEQIVDSGYGNYKITGTFTNTTDKEVKYVQVEYVLKDASGAQIGTATANTTNLAANTPWKFEAAALSPNGTPASFELKQVTGF
ncbi:MAG: FxLYD domain-containing protein [Eggerthellaceae bacterium]|jgi:ribosomal protein L40E|nr:FxLYD domain-containing protein [Eggerthellaceae bacterium]